MIDGTKSRAEVIALAYQAQRFTPNQEGFRQNVRKKTYNPIHTAPTLNRVITHMAGTKNGKDYPWMKRQAGKIVLDPDADGFIRGLGTPGELREFMATLSLFLKTAPVKGKKGMNAFVDSAQESLTPADVVKAAYNISTKIHWKKGQYNINKMTKLAGRVRGSQEKWECLAVLAQYYPLSGVPQPLINHFVDQLGTLDVQSFQELVNQVLVFYKAEA